MAMARLSDPTPRMTLPRALLSEALRLARSPLAGVHLVCGLAAGLACGEYFSVTRWDPALGADAYAQFLGALMPLMSAIVCGLAVDEERAAGRLANLTAVPSRGRAVAAKLLALAALGAGALAVALGVFGAVLAVAGRLPLGPAPLAAAWAGIVLGSLPLYALGLGVALRLGRNAAIGAGAAGMLLAFFSVGGLAHGLMTGELTGALATPLSWVPLAWPARLGSLGVEAFIVCGLAAGLACGEYFSVTRWDPALGADAYAQFLGALMPLMSAIVCGLAVDEERAAGRLANLTAVPSRGRAVAAKLLALAALGAGALAVALGVFGAVLAVAGRLPLGPAPLAAAWAGIVLGSLPLYALGLGVALRLGRNAAIGAGAAGMLLAFFSVGGLAHGLMTGELTGALATPLSWVPLAWPARLGSLGVEAFIDAARAAGPLLTTALAGLVLALATAAVLIAWFCRFEDGRADA